jgi:hypothetical protein
MTLGLCLASLGCAARMPSWPTGPPQPVADAQSVLDTLTAACRAVRTLTADLALSGHSGTGRLRGRVQAGFRAPDDMRLEGLAPFGPPVFVLASTAAATTLLLPRDDRVHTGTPARQLVEALSGLALDGAALRAVLTGCVSTQTTALDAMRFTDGRMIVRAADDATLLAQDGRIVGGNRDGLRVDYQAFVGDFPSVLRVTSAGGGGTIDATIRLSSIETNRELGDEAFQVAVSVEAQPLTLEQVRRLGPLGGAP